LALLLLKRLGWALVTLLGVTALTFVVLYRMPADPADLLAGPTAPPEVKENIRRQLKLDRPVWEQYATFLGRLTRGDLGESYVTRQPVTTAIAARLPATAVLALSGWACWLVIGTLLGVGTAAKSTRTRESILLFLSVLGVSTPTFWVGILLLQVFVAKLRWLPAGGVGGPDHLVLPVVTLAVAGVAYYARLTYSSMTQTLREDFVRTAVAKGLPPNVVLFRHAFRNALLPLVTIAGTDLAALLGGVVFTESVFDWKGMGKLAVEAVNSLDVPLIVGIVLVSAVFVVVANLVVDLLYPLLDPRIRPAGS
jgi:peptide/nickel transport system permease protein